MKVNSCLFVFFIVLCSINSKAQCPTLLLTNDNLPSLPAVLADGETLQICWDVIVDEASFTVDDFEMEYEILANGQPVNFDFLPTYYSGLGIDAAASGQICFEGEVPAPQYTYTDFTVSLNIFSIYYLNSTCIENTVAFDLNLTIPPLTLDGPDINVMFVLLTTQGFFPLETVVVFSESGEECPTIIVDDYNPNFFSTTFVSGIVPGEFFEFCFDIIIDETNFEPSDFTFDCNFMASGSGVNVPLTSAYGSGYGISPNSTGRMCFRGVIPDSPVPYTAYLLSVKFQALTYTNPNCESTLVAYNKNITNEAPLILSDVNIFFSTLQAYDLLIQVGTVQVLAGCTDSNACNYVPGAIYEDNSCIYSFSICDDGLDLTINDEYDENCICIGQLLGCINPDACNFNPDAAADDGSCLIIGSNCDDNNDLSINDVIDENCECTGQIFGCIDVYACNYSADANTDDNSCIYWNTSCDDGDDETINDVYDYQCNCSGVLATTVVLPQIAFEVHTTVNNSLLNIWFEEKILDDISIRIVDLSGKLTFQNAFQSNQKICINIENLSNGIHIILFETSGQIASKKFLKE